MSKFAAPHEDMAIKIVHTVKIIAIPGFDVVATENFSYKNFCVPFAYFSAGIGSPSSPA